MNFPRNKFTRLEKKIQAYGTLPKAKNIYIFLSYLRETGDWVVTFTSIHYTSKEIPVHFCSSWIVLCNLTYLKFGLSSDGWFSLTLFTNFEAIQNCSRYKNILSKVNTEMMIFFIYAWYTNSHERNIADIVWFQA